MRGYQAIADVSNSIVGMLREFLVPDIVSHGDKIFLGNPGENTQASLCVSLYNIEQERRTEAGGMVNEGIRRQRYPSQYLSLYYMITAISNSDIKFRASEEQKILGRVMQGLHDYSVLDIEELKVTDNSRLPHIKISLLNLEQEEKLKLFHFPGIAYKCSLFYKVSIVEIQSARQREISRVYETDFAFHKMTDKENFSGGA